MGNVFYSLWNQIYYVISTFRILDLIDILVIAYIIYKAIGFFSTSRSGQLLKGILVLFVIYLLSNWLELVSVKWILSIVFDSALIIAAVIFQPELRRILEKVGRTNFTKGQLSESDEMTVCIDNVSRAISTMQENKIGALIVFEHTTQLGEIISTGTIIDAESSVSMINNIFFPKSPLHDGALIVREGRLYAAGCILPLTQREDLSLQLGTRHRAAIGMTENSDAVVLVVSEETGIISLVSNGQITRNYSPVSAGAELKRLLIANDEKKSSSTFKKVSSFIKNLRKDGNK